MYPPFGAPLLVRASSGPPRRVRLAARGPAGRAGPLYAGVCENIIMIRKNIIMIIVMIVMMNSSMCIHISVYIYIYIYIQRERERDAHTHNYIITHYGREGRFVVAAANQGLESYFCCWVSGQSLACVQKACFSQTLV